MDTVHIPELIMKMKHWLVANRLQIAILMLDRSFSKMFINTSVCGLKYC